MQDETITLQVEIPKDSAYQLAQFCKRLAHSHCYDLTEAHLSHDERKARAYQMLAGIEALREALAKAGYAPR